MQIDPFLIFMGELAIVDDSGNSSLEVTFQKHAEVPNVRLFTHASDQLTEDGFEKERIVLLGIELFVVESDYLVKETAFPPTCRSSSMRSATVWGGRSAVGRSCGRVRVSAGMRRWMTLSLPLAGSC